MTVRPALLTALLCSLLPLSVPQAARAQAARVDPATPRTQSGMTLIAVVRGDGNGQYRFPVPANLSFLSGPTSNGPPGGIGLWVKGIAPPPPPVGHRRSFQGFTRNVAPPTAGAQGPGRETLPVQCQPQYLPSPNGQASATPLYFLSLPGGYPAGYGPIDVDMYDVRERHAHWRLLNLPPSYHAIAGAVAPRAAFTHGPVTLRVQAWRDNGPPFIQSNSNAAEFRGIGFQIGATVPPRSQWEVQITKTQLEWEALRPGEQSAPRYPPNFPHPVQFTAFFGGTPPGAPPDFPPHRWMQSTVRTPYGAHDRYLRLSGRLVQMATAQETLTFHNVNVRSRPNPYANSQRPIGRNGRPLPRYVPPPSYEISGPPQMATTPSGISVTLLSPSSLPQNQGFGGGFWGNAVQMVLKFNGPSPGMGMMGMASVSLPRSPLARQYHKPVAFTLQATRPYLLQNLFPVGGYFPQQGAGQREFMATLMLPPAPPRFVTRPNAPRGARFPVFTPPAMPKYFKTLALTVVQRAELKAIPVSFLVPISSQVPPSAYPQFPRRIPVPRRSR